MFRFKNFVIDRIWESQGPGALIPNKILPVDIIDAYLEYKKDLRNILFTTQQDYKYNQITLTNGKTRLIQEPNFMLKVIQNYLLETELEKRFKLHPAATCVKGKGYIYNANLHVNAKHVFKTDIKSFFQNVAFSKRKSDSFSLEDYSWLYTNRDLFFINYDTALPTGAPTSPFLANLWLEPLDKKIQEIASDHGGIYSRYLDDIVMSFKTDLTDTQRHEIKKSIIALIVQAGYQPHPSKTGWINPCNDQFIVTGVDIRTVPKVTGLYIKNEIRPAIERDVSETITAALLGSVLDKPVTNLDEVIQFHFIRSKDKIGYVKQVNKNQYEILKKHIVKRFSIVQIKMKESQSLFLKKILYSSPSLLGGYLQKLEEKRFDNIDSIIESINSRVVYVETDSREHPNGYIEDDLPF